MCKSRLRGGSIGHVAPTRAAGICRLGRLSNRPAARLRCLVGCLAGQRLVLLIAAGQRATK